MQQRQRRNLMKGVRCMCYRQRRSHDRADMFDYINSDSINYSIIEVHWACCLTPSTILWVKMWHSCFSSAQINCQAAPPPPPHPSRTTDSCYITPSYWSASTLLNTSRALPRVYFIPSTSRALSLQPWAVFVAALLCCVLWKVMMTEGTGTRPPRLSDTPMSAETNHSSCSLALVAHCQMKDFVCQWGCFWSGLTLAPPPLGGNLTLFLLHWARWRGTITTPTSSW